MMHIIVLGDLAGGGVIMAGILVIMVSMAVILGVGAVLIIKGIRSKNNQDKGDQ